MGKRKDAHPLGPSLSIPTYFSAASARLGTAAAKKLFHDDFMGSDFQFTLFK
jgi:hypothetical protein